MSICFSKGDWSESSHLWIIERTAAKNGLSCSFQASNWNVRFVTTSNNEQIENPFRRFLFSFLKLPWLVLIKSDIFPLFASPEFFFFCVLWHSKSIFSETLFQEAEGKNWKTFIWFSCHLIEGISIVKVSLENILVNVSCFDYCLVLVLRAVINHSHLRGWQLWRRKPFASLLSVLFYFI